MNNKSKKQVLRLQSAILKTQYEICISRFEWDFSTCRDEELNACYAYEFMRESSRMRELVKEWRNAHPGAIFDDWVPIAKDLNGEHRPQFWGHEMFHFFPEWPEQPYLKVPEIERKRRRDLVPKYRQPDNPRLALQIEHLPKLIKECLEPCPFGGDRIAPPQDRLTIRSVDGIHESVLFLIDWRHSKKRIAQLFQKWVVKNEPKTNRVSQWKVKGKGTQEEQMKAKLKALGALRLIRTYGHWNTAAQVSLNESKKSLFENQAAWIRAVKDAELAISTMPHLPGRAKEPKKSKMKQS